MEVWIFKAASKSGWTGVISSRSHCNPWRRLDEGEVSTMILGKTGMRIVAFDGFPIWKLSCRAKVEGPDWQHPNLAKPVYLYTRSECSRNVGNLTPRFPRAQHLKSSGRTRTTESNVANRRLVDSHVPKCLVRIWSDVGDDDHLHARGAS